MEASSPSSVSFLNNEAVRRWISRAFIVSILVYLVVLGYLIAESVTGASRWAPYGVNIPIFIGLVIGSELVMLVTAVQIFRADSGIWPAAISEGWSTVRSGSIAKGTAQILSAAWDISLIDLRLRTGTAILMGRLNRIASIVPLVYALAASAGGAPWGLRGSALFDIAISLVVWAFMELVMVRPNEEAAPAAHEVAAAAGGTGKQSRYSVRLVRLSDLDRLEELERRVWRDQAASREVIARRISTYPEGQVAAIHTTVENGVPTRSKVAAWCTFMPASGKHVESFRTWDDLTSNGTISACDRDGDVMIGVNLTSVIEGGTYLLSAEALVSVVEGGKTKLMMGSRLTGFVSFNGRRKAEGKPRLSADAYARLKEIRGFRINEQRLDEGKDILGDDEYQAQAGQRIAQGRAPLTEDDVPDYVSSNVRGYMSIPGVRIVRVVPNYFRDPASADYGVILDWPNPIPRPVRHIPIIKRFVMRRIREEIAAEWEQRKQHLRDLAARRAKRSIPAYLRNQESSPTAADAIDKPAAVEEGTREKSAMPGP